METSNGTTIESLAGFSAGGRTIRTTNENGASERDQGMLWEGLMREGFLFPLLEASGENAIWGIYSNYEKDWTRPYDFTLAARRAHDAVAVSGGTVIDVPGGDYAVFRASASTPQEASVRVWQSVWAWSAANPEKRAYGIDLERWDPAELMQGGSVSVAVYISLAT